jgi:hypothetical protein
MPDNFSPQWGSSAIQWAAIQWVAIQWVNVLLLELIYFI